MTAKRSHHLPRVSKNEATSYEPVRALAQYHIVAVRKKKNGEIVAVKHASFGWMSVASYYALDEFHRWLPTINELIRTGYDLKGKVWLTPINFDIFGSGVSIPFGVFLAALVILDISTQSNTIAAAKADLASLQSQLDPIIAQINAINAQIAVYQNLINTGQYTTEGGRHHHQKSGGEVPVVYSLQELQALIAALQAELATVQAQLAALQAQLGPQIQSDKNDIKNAQILQIALPLAFVLPFGEIFFAWRYGMILYNLATSVYNDATDFLTHFTDSGPHKTPTGGGYYWGNTVQLGQDFLYSFVTQPANALNLGGYAQGLIKWFSNL